MDITRAEWCTLRDEIVKTIPEKEKWKELGYDHLTVEVVLWNAVLVRCQLWNNLEVVVNGTAVFVNDRQFRQDLVQLMAAIERRPGGYVDLLGKAVKRNSAKRRRIEREQQKRLQQQELEVRKVLAG